MFCSECGNKLFDGAKFCPNCGTPVFVPKTEPAPEHEVVEEVQETVEEVAEDVQEAAEEIQDSVEEAAEEIQQTAEEVVEETREAVEEAVDAVDEVVEEAAEDIQEAAEEIAEEVQDTVAETSEEIQEAAEDAVNAVDEANEDFQDYVEETVEDFAGAVEEAAEEVQDTAEETAAEVQQAAEEAKPADNDVQAAVKAVGEDMKKAAKAVAGSAAVAAKNRGTVETAAMVLAAASVLFFFISLSKASLVLKIFMIIAAGILTFLTAGKHKYPSIIYAVPMCINAVYQVCNSARLIILSITNRYYRYSPGTLNTLYKLILIAVAVLLIILGADAIRKRRSVNKAILAGSVLLAIYHLIRFFSSLRSGRAILMLNLAMLLFYAAYVAVCLCFEKNGQDAPEPDVMGAAYEGREKARSNYSYGGTRGTGTAAADSAPLFAAPEGFSAAEDKAPLFGESSARKDPAPMFGEEPKAEPAQADFVVDPSFIFCVRCGAKLPADSAFCNKCGAPVVK